MYLHYLLIFFLLAPKSKLVLTIALFYLIKWLLNYRKCTLSYLECKLRSVPKEEGYLNNFLENTMTFSSAHEKILAYVIVLLTIHKVIV